MKNGAAHEPGELLLVDDDPASLAMLALSLRRCGFRVAACSDPDAALDQLRRRRYRWLVTDARMTPHDGFELASAAKSVQDDLRVVMVSAVASDGDIQDGQIERVFPKPVALEPLIAWLLATPPGRNGASHGT